MGATQNSKQLACTTCAKAKSRCIPGPPDSGKCERCSRLSKPCISRAPAPPRPKTQTRRSRVADLERRLSELSSQFQGGQSAASEQPDSPPLEQNATEEGHQQRQTQETSPVVSPEVKSQQSGNDLPWNPRLHYGLFPAVFSETEDGDANESAWPTRKDALHASASSLPTMSGVPWPVGEEANRMLDRFHRVLTCLSPFVVVPRDLSSDELLEKRPFLWKGIMVACAFVQGRRQRLLGEQFLEEITRTALVLGESSLDVLQGLLLFVSWYHHSLKSTRVVSILFLARSICLNLELGLGGKEQWLDRLEDGDLDHLRAYAGTYYLNTVAFTTNKRVDVLMHTSFLESCCTVLETANREPSDALLVQLVRVQEIAQSIAHTVIVDPSQQVMQLPLMMVVQSFQSQLESLRQALPPELANNDMLTTHISAAEVLLGEVGLSESHCQSSLTSTDRLRVLWYCLRSLRAFFDVRCQKNSEVQHPRYLCMRGLDVTYALLTAGRLVTLKLPGWDLDQVERELGFWGIMDWLTDFLQSLTTARREMGVGYDSESATTAAAAAADPGAVTEDSLERLLRVATGLKMVLRQEISRAKQDNRAANGGWYPSPDGEAGKPAQDGDYGGELWKDMVDDYQWDMVGEFQWL